MDKEMFQREEFNDICKILEIYMKNENQNTSSEILENINKIYAWLNLIMEKPNITGSELVKEIIEQYLDDLMGAYQKEKNSLQAQYPNCNLKELPFTFYEMSNITDCFRYNVWYQVSRYELEALELFGQNIVRARFYLEKQLTSYFAETELLNLIKAKEERKKQQKNDKLLDVIALQQLQDTIQSLSGTFHLKKFLYILFEEIEQLRLNGIDIDDMINMYNAAFQSLNSDVENQNQELSCQHTKKK